MQECRAHGMESKFTNDFIHGAEVYAIRKMKQLLQRFMNYKAIANAHFDSVTCDNEG